MKKKPLTRNLVITAVWTTLIVCGVLAVTSYQDYHRRHSLGTDQARVVQDLGKEWLQEAQMHNRVAISKVSLKKDADDKIVEVRVYLNTSESLKENYQEKLIAYLNYRGITQTGVPYQFLF
nr:hypothetical protein CKG001_18020 [Bdellovibrio sp. CKG001]